MSAFTTTVALAIAAQTALASPLDEASTEVVPLGLSSRQPSAQTDPAGDEGAATVTRVAEHESDRVLRLVRASNVGTHRVTPRIATKDEGESAAVPRPRSKVPRLQAAAVLARGMDSQRVPGELSRLGTVPGCCGIATAAMRSVHEPAPPADPFADAADVDDSENGATNGEGAVRGDATGEQSNGQQRIESLKDPFGRQNGVSQSPRGDGTFDTNGYSKEDIAYYDSLARPGLSDARRARIGRDLIIGGSVLLVSSWLVAGWWGANAIDGAYAGSVGVPEETDRAQRRLYGGTLMIPVVGPFVATPFAGSGVEAYLTSTLLGATQAGGLAMIITGAVTRKRALARLRFQASPIAGGGIQLRVGGRF